MNLGPIKGSFVFGVFVVAAFIASAFGFKSQSDQIKTLETQVVKPAPTAVVVTPTSVPTATPSAALNVKSAVKSGGLKISTPAAANNTVVTKPVVK